jgi:hypothetical protein
MSGELPSAMQQEASKAQAEAAHSGEEQKEKARQLQSKADRAAVPKHGL